MRLRDLTGTVCALAVASAAQAGIRLWDGDPNKCIINQIDKRVTITGQGTFRLEATFGDVGLAEINRIWVYSLDPNFPVPSVTVYVTRDPNHAGGNWHAPGCTKLRAVDLVTGVASGGGTLAEARCTSDLGTDNSILAATIGTCAVGGSVLDEIDITGAHLGQRSSAPTRPSIRGLSLLIRNPPPGTPSNQRSTAALGWVSLAAGGCFPARRDCLHRTADIAIPHPDATSYKSDSGA